MRSVVEGLAFELRRHLDILREAQMPLSDLTMCGGAARSSFTAQMVSDISQLPVRCSAVTEGSMYGAVIMARGLTEPNKSLDQLSLGMVPKAEAVYYPDSQSSLYQPLYQSYLSSLTDFCA
jgi:L-xylulokinase